MNVKFKFIQSKKGIYSVRFFIRGQKYQTTLDTMERSVANQRAAEYLEKVVREIDLGVNTVRSITKSYLNFIKDKTYYKDEVHRMEVLDKKLGSKKLTDLNKEMCRNFFFDLTRNPSPHTKRMMSETTKRAYLVSYKSLFTFAMRDGKIDFNPFDIFPKGKGPKYQRKGREFSILELKNLTKVLKDINKDKSKSKLWRQFYHFFNIIMYSGARPKEVYHLRWSDFNILDDERVQFIVSAEISKNRKMRKVELPKWVWDELVNIKKIEGYDSKDYVFDLVRRTSDVYGGKMWGIVRAKAGVVEGRLYDIRHSYITQRVRDNANYKALSEQVGHSSSQITLDIYTHTSDADRKALVNKVKKIG